MALKDLTQLDFDYYRNYAKDMANCHEKEFMEEINPDLMRAYYRGKNKSKSQSKFYSNENLNSREHYVTYSRIFQESNTILSNLYPQNIRIMAAPAKEATEDSAALMTALQNHYLKELRQKEENAEAIMWSWFCGIGWKKTGYRIEFMPRIQDPESIVENKQGLLGMAKDFLFGKPDSNESKERPEIVDWEGPFNSSESPLNVMTDHKADLRNRKCVLHQLKRTLYELKIFGNYDEEILQEVFEKTKYTHGSRLSDREIELTLKELHVQQRNGLWILSWVEEHSKPLRYDKSTVQGDGDDFEPLVLTNEPGVRYPVSHMKMATQIQENIDYLATIGIRILDRVRNQIIVNEKILSPGQKATIEQNKLGGIIWTNKPVTGTDYAQLSSPPVSNDLLSFLSLFQQNATEVLGSNEQMISGISKNKTLGQDKIATMGTQMRESGMVDRVNDWMVRQAYKMGRLLKQYSNSEIVLKITGKDYFDRKTGEKTKDKWVRFMTTDNPLGAKHELVGEYDYTMNIYEALKINSGVAQKQLFDLYTLMSNPMSQDTLLKNNKKFRNDLLLEELIKSFEVISSPDRFLEDLDSRQVGAIMAEKVMMQNGGMMPMQGTQETQENQALPQEAST